MSRRLSNPHHYSYHSPGGHGSSGEEGFRSPRPQYQSSPRPYGHNRGGHKGFIGHQNHGNYNYHSNMSPIAHTSPGSGEMSHNLSYSRASPAHNPSPNFKGNRSRGRGGRFRSGGRSPYARQDVNPGGSDDIRDYIHPSMLEDPWENLEPVSISQTPVQT